MRTLDGPPAGALKGVTAGAGYVYGNLTTAGSISGRLFGQSIAYGNLISTAVEEPVDQIFFPLDIDVCFENDNVLSLYGGETPSGIAEWVADPDANPALLDFEPLDTDECFSNERSLRVYTQ